MSYQQKNLKKVDILAASAELAQLLHGNENYLDQEVIDRGNELLEFFTDENLAAEGTNFDTMKIEALKLAIDDLSTGGKLMRKSLMGLFASRNEFFTFAEPYGEKPSKAVAYSISMKNAFPKDDWRISEDFELSQEDLNAAIYRLVFAWSELIQ
jgi:hypothetical protein